MAQDLIDKKLFSWLDVFDGFGVSSKKCQRSADGDIVGLDETFLLASKTTEFLNATESTAYEASNKTVSDATLMESAEGQLEPSTKD